MEITTKFNPGDEVYFLNETKLIKKEIHSLKVEVENNPFLIPEIKYWFMFENPLKFETKKESEVFESRGDFLIQLEDEPFEVTEVDFIDINGIFSEL
jgi:hypothetical protein